jgi:hypothetical protein
MVAIALGGLGFAGGLVLVAAFFDLGADDDLGRPRPLFSGMGAGEAFNLIGLAALGGDAEYA